MSEKKMTLNSLVPGFIKTLVSKKKKRYVEDGFDLDLAYISPNIIAMVILKKFNISQGFPALSIESVYRNKMEDVQKFLETKHKDNYKVYNLCAEKAYESSCFHHRVERFPFEDHKPPPFDLILPFSKSVELYLKDKPKHVAVVHCKAGKGRTGTMVASYLLYSGQYSTWRGALDFFSEKRTQNKKGVTIPSQIRYVAYFEQYMKNKMKEPAPLQRLLPLTIRVGSPPNVGALTYYVIDINNQMICSTDQAGIIEYDKNTDEIVFKYPMKEYLKGDIGFYFHIPSVYKKDPKAKSLFHFWFNTSFVGEKLIFKKEDLDHGYKDSKVPENCDITLKFQTKDFETMYGFEQFDEEKELPKIQTDLSKYEIPNDVDPNTVAQFLQEYEFHSVTH